MRKHLYRQQLLQKDCNGQSAAAAAAVPVVAVFLTLVCLKQVTKQCMHCKLHFSSAALVLSIECMTSHAVAVWSSFNWHRLAIARRQAGRAQAVICSHINSIS
jgi:hypothetical protein